MMSYYGSCLCQAVKFEIDEFLPGIGHCHCSMCRKFHGAEYATIASVAPDKFRWLQGEDALQDYHADNGTTRTFCRHCGSSIRFASPRAPSEVEIALGTMDGVLPVRPDAHIFVGSAANWSVLMDDLPHYDEARGSEIKKK
ncbi:MAG: GFA family protein [Gammaproteobacteria bacterium]|nr:GFA family protein [Gammaproteobacteria bacterium]NNF62014.1 GFA family protein [Gammaproteobacteria bacterium]